jgi:hypothetical protein
VRRDAICTSSLVSRTRVHWEIRAHIIASAHLAIRSDQRALVVAISRVAWLALSHERQSHPRGSHGHSRDWSETVPNIEGNDAEQAAAALGMTTLSLKPDIQKDTSVEVTFGPPKLASFARFPGMHIGRGPTARGGKTFASFHRFG